MPKSRNLDFVGIVFLFWYFCFSFRPIFAYDSTLRQKITHAKQSVFKLKFIDGTYVGSGFMINTLGNMLTCAHVVDSSRSGSGRYVNKLLAENFLSLERDSTYVDTDVVTYRVTVDTVIPSLDLAILTVDLKKPYFKKTENPNIYIARPVFMGFANTDDIWEGQEIFTCAYIKDDFSIPKPIIAKGVVSTIRKKCYDLKMKNEVDIAQLDMNISKGNSGAPVFLPDDGRVIGIIDAGIFGDSILWQTGYAVAITTNQILDKLRELKIPFDYR